MNHRTTREQIYCILAKTEGRSIQHSGFFSKFAFLESYVTEVTLYIGGIFLHEGQLQNDVLGNKGQLRNIQS